MGNIKGTCAWHSAFNALALSGLAAFHSTVRLREISLLVTAVATSVGVNRPSASRALRSNLICLFCSFVNTILLDENLDDGLSLETTPHLNETFSVD